MGCNRREENAKYEFVRRKYGGEANSAASDLCETIQRKFR